MPVFGNKDKRGRTVANLATVEGCLPGYPDGWAVSATLEDDALAIRARVGRFPEVRLPYARITACGSVTERELSEKSVLGRAAVGGLLLGPLGAVVGAVDGTTAKRRTRRFVVVDYVSKDGDERALALEVVGASLGWDKLVRGLRERIPQGPPLPETIEL